VAALRAAPATEVTDPAFSQALARLALQLASDLVTIHGEEGVYLYVSPRGLAPFGLEVSDVVGHQPRELVHPDDLERFETQIKTSVRTGASTGTGTGTIAWRARCGDGSYRLVESHVCGIRVDGVVRLVVATTRDMQDVHDRALEEREHAEGLAALGALAAGAAHEINNPLTWMLANIDEMTRRVETLLPGAAAASELKVRLLEVRDGVLRIGALAREMKHLGRRHSDGRAVVDLRHVLDSALGVVWNQLRHRATLTKDYREPPRVLANDARLGQVFANLLLNAVQALPEGREPDNAIRLVTGSTDEGEAFVDVIDNGPGIPDDVRARIFEAFFTTKPEGVGTGLGLAVCKGIVEKSGGVIEVESGVGAGTRFRVRLPAYLESVEETPLPDVAGNGSRAAEPAPERPSRRLGILVVDDEPLIGRVIARMLGDAHEVTVHTRAAAALATLKAGARFDLILCDLMMPGMTGADLYEEALQLDPAQAERMWFLTGGAFTERARSYLEKAGERHLAKPFTSAELAAVVERFTRNETGN